jgi:nuclear pore complex protein Nup107
MEPLFHDFLTHTEDPTDDERFRAMREAYLPDMIIGYITALTFAGTFLSREHFLKCLELSSIITSDENKELVEALQKTKRVYLLVHTLGMANRQLLRMNEMAMKNGEEGSGKTRASKRRKVSGGNWRSDEGRTLELWNVEEGVGTTASWE